MSGCAIVVIEERFGIGERGIDSVCQLVSIATATVLRGPFEGKQHRVCAAHRLFVLGFPDDLTMQDDDLWADEPN